MTTMTENETHAVVLLVRAAAAQVERGHFAEAYEGFNNCPFYERERNHRSLDDCTCGIREAVAALDAAEAVGWFSGEQA